jgi:hypothetical protein
MTGLSFWRREFQVADVDLDFYQRPFFHENENGFTNS